MFCADQIMFSLIKDSMTMQAWQSVQDSELMLVMCKQNSLVCVNYANADGEGDWVH